MIDCIVVQVKFINLLHKYVKNSVRNNRIPTEIIYPTYLIKTYLELRKVLDKLH